MCESQIVREKGIEEERERERDREREREIKRQGKMKQRLGKIDGEPEARIEN